MLEKDDGLVLRTAPSGETSLLVTFLSRGAGKIRLVAKGARAARSRVRGILESGNHVEALYYFKEGRSVFYLKEAAQLSPPFRARDSLPHLAARLAAMELLDQVCYPGSADAHIVDLGAEFVRCDDAADPLSLFLVFEVRLLEALGVLPEVSGCVRCGRPLGGGWYSARNGSGVCAEHGGEPGTGGRDSERMRLSPDLVEAVSSCLAKPLREHAGVRFGGPVRKQLGKLIHWTYTFHVQGYSLPKSLSLI